MFNNAIFDYQLGPIREHAEAMMRGWKALDDEVDGGDAGDAGDGGALDDSLGGAALASNVLLGENPLRRGRFKDLLSSSRVFRSMP